MLFRSIGQTGMALVKMITEAGGKCIVSDLNTQAMMKAHDEYDATFIGTRDIMGVECDVFLPCALGGILTPTSIQSLKCDIVCGLANNQLSHESASKWLMAKGITYVPDYVANAGGIMHASTDIKCMENSTFDRSSDAIEMHIMRTTKNILEISRRTNVGTNLVANDLAESIFNAH